jgi:hypothetical protein
MANAWFRFYAEFEDDPKVQMMSEVDQRRLALLFCQRCKEEIRTDEQRSFKWRVSLAEVARTKAVFLANGFIDEDWNLLNWNKRQFLSDSSTDRVRNHRRRLKNKPLEQDETLLKQDETKHETKRNGLDQIQIRSDQKQNRGRSDTGLTPLVSIFSKLPNRSSPLPKNRNEMVTANYKWSNDRPCTVCGEELEWWTSPKGGSIPVLKESGAVHLGNCAEVAKAAN